MNKTLMKVLLFVFGVIIATLFVNSAFGNHYPQYKNYINDFANVINDSTEEKLNKKLKEYDQKTSNQVVVATIKSLKGEEIEDYSIHLADQWAPGTKEKDNGVIILLAMDDRKMRIEVGQGLEGDITDIEARHILDDIVRPDFKEQKYNEGIVKGVDAIILSIATDSAALAQTNDMSGLFALALIIGIFIIVIIVITLADSPYTPIGGQGSRGITDVYRSSGGSFFSSGSKSSSSSRPKFGGGGFSGGGSSSSW